MTGTGPAPDRAPAVSNLVLRIGSALVLAPVAIGTAYIGGWPFALFWGIAGVAALWEWIGMAAGRGHRLMFAAAALALGTATLFAGQGRPGVAIMVIAMGVLAAIFAPPDRQSWIVSGILYAGALLLAPIVLRADPAYGFLAIIFLFAIVWTTDVLAYFAGRAFGGPKLAPAISPKKTWSGAIAGALGATALTVVGAGFIGSFDVVAIALVALLLSVASQAGDLLESWIKRRFGAKDSSQLIPGHGGVLDRLDGFWAAALVACIVGVTRGGFENAAGGLMIW